MTEQILTAIGLVLFIEGLLYTLFPQAMVRMMIRILTLTPDALRRTGALVAFVGFALIYLVWRF